MTTDPVARALLRGGALVLVLLLLWNPAIPGDDPVAGAGGGTGSWVVVEGHPLLGEAALTDAEGAAGEALRELHGRLRDPSLDETTRALVLPSGLHILARPGEALDPLPAPGEAPPRPVLARVLRDLADAGADSILLLSTFRADPVPLRGVLAELEARRQAGRPVPALEMEVLGGEVRNAGVSRLSLPRDVALDRPFEARVRIVGEGGADADSVDLRLVLQPGEPEESVLAEVRRPLPEEGSFEDVLLPVPSGWMGEAPAEAPPGMVEAVVELAGDLWPADDRRRVRLDAVPEGIVLVSVSADWEPRTLLPVLEQSTGLEGEGWLLLGAPEAPAGWLALHGPGGAPALGPGTAAPDGTALARRMETARLLVIHGVGDRALPDPFLEAVAAHPAVLHLPAGPAGLALPGLEALGAGADPTLAMAPMRPGRWSVDPELPLSPIRGALQPLQLSDLPTLAGGVEAPALAPGEPLPSGVTVPLRIRQSADPEPRAALALLEGSDGRRAAVALARDFRRWGVRDGAPRQAYLELWSGVGGWLLASGGTPSPVTDAAPPAGTSPRPVAAPGGWGGDTPPGSGHLAPRSLVGPLAMDGSVAHGARSGAGRPLRTHPAPWLLLLAVLLTGWILRRRAGLA